MLSEEMKDKLAAIQIEQPDEVDLHMLREAETENAGGESVAADEYFAKRKSSAVFRRNSQ